MKQINQSELFTKWTALAEEYYCISMPTSALKDLCKKAGISLGNGWLKEYEKAQVIFYEGRNRVCINRSITEKQIRLACLSMAQRRKEYRENCKERDAFNLNVEVRNNPEISDEVMIRALEMKGYKVIAVKAGDIITHTHTEKSKGKVITTTTEYTI